MKKLTAALCVVLFLVCSSLGQKTDKTKISVVWSANPNCHTANTAETKALSPQCSMAEVDGVKFYIVNYAGVSYAMSHRKVRDFLVASVQISNKSDAAIAVNPLRSKVTRFKNVEGFMANGKGESFSARSQDELRHASYEDSTYVAESDGGVRDGLRVQPRYENVMDGSGRVVSRVTRIEPAPPASSRPVPAQVRSEVVVPRAVFDYVMKSRTLAAGEKIAGHIVFKDSEKKDYIVFFMDAGPIEFVFPTVDD